MPTTSRVSAGLRSSKVSPVEDSTHSPSMKFLRTLVGVWLRVAGEARVSVAMIAPVPYECLDIDATGGREGAARRRRRDAVSLGNRRVWRVGQAQRLAPFFGHSQFANPFVHIGSI